MKQNQLLVYSLLLLVAQSLWMVYENSHIQSSSLTFWLVPICVLVLTIILARGRKRKWLYPLLTLLICYLLLKVSDVWLPTEAMENSYPRFTRIIVFMIESLTTVASSLFALVLLAIFEGIRRLHDFLYKE